MNSKRKEPALPTIALFATTNQAIAIGAAITHYLCSIKRNPDRELQEAALLLEDFHRHLIQQTRMPPGESPTDIEILAHLAQLNAFLVKARQLDPHSEAYRQLSLDAVMCQFQLRERWAIPIYLDSDTLTWRLGTVFSKAKREQAKQQAAHQMSQSLTTGGVEE